MMYGHWKAHMNDAIRNNFTVKSVAFSHSKKQCVIVVENIDTEKLKSVVSETGYELKDIKSEPYEKKGFFSKFGTK